MNVPAGFLVLLLALWRLGKDRVDGRGERFDWVGALLYCAGLAAVVAGFGSLPALWGLIALPVGILGLVAFALRQLRTTSPLLDLRLFLESRALAFSNLAALINYSATAAVGLLLSMYLQYNRFLSPETAGLILLAQPVLQASLSPLAGRLSDRVQPRIVASIGMSMTVVGPALLAFLSSETPLVLVILDLAWLGVSFALFSSPNTNAVMSSVAQPFYGVIAGTLATMRTLGQTVLSMGIAMLVFSAVMGNEPITEANAGRFLVAARAANGVFASLARGNTLVDEGSD